MKTYKDDNNERMRSLELRWREDAQARAFERDVERMRYRGRVKAEAKMRETLAQMRDAKAPSAWRHVGTAFVVLGKIARFLVIGTLVLFTSVLLGIMGASKKR